MEGVGERVLPQKYRRRSVLHSRAADKRFLKAPECRMIGLGHGKDLPRLSVFAAVSVRFYAFIRCNLKSIVVCINIRYSGRSFYIFNECITSTAKKSAISLTSSFLNRKHCLLTYVLFAHELKNFQSSYFVQLFNFKEGITSAAK